MAKHWHLTTDPFNRADFGGAMATRKSAEQLAKATRRHSSRPICRHSRIRHAAGDGTCTAPYCRCESFDDAIGRPLIEVLADDD
jgi:hypothetical protein